MTNESSGTLPVPVASDSDRLSTLAHFAQIRCPLGGMERTRSRGRGANGEDRAAQLIDRG
jgi:hypothetical protein